MRNRVIHFFGNISMTNGHKGLAQLAGNKVDIDNLKPGEFVAFINKPFTAMKLLAPGGILVYWKQPSHRLLYKDVVDNLPHFLSGMDVGFSKEVAVAIAKYYKKYLHHSRKVASIAAKRQAHAAGKTAA